VLGLQAHTTAPGVDWFLRAKSTWFNLVMIYHPLNILLGLICYNCLKCLFCVQCLCRDYGL
jgi:uncharacterized membrane protein YhdT